MRCFRDYADEAARFASPYISRAGEFFGDAGDSAKQWYKAKKREYQRRYNPTPWDKLCDAISGSIRVIMIIAGIIGTIAAGIVVARAIMKKLYCSSHKIVSYDSSAAEPESAETTAPEAEEPEYVEVPEAETAEETEAEETDTIKKEKGYIVL